MAQKPIKVSVDTTNDDSVCIYNNIRKGDTLLMHVNISQGSVNLNLTGQTMHIVLRKADGYSVEKIIKNITSSNFDVAFDVQATLAVGDVEGIVEISDLSGTDITNTFTFEVKENPSTDIVIKSADQIETLQQIVALINTYNANADNLAIQNQLAIQNKTDLTTLNATSETLANRLETDIANGTDTAVRLEDDIATGNTLDSNLKGDIATANTSHNTLVIDIANGNDIISKLPTLNFNTILSYIDLMNTMLKGSRLTDGNGNYLTDGNGNYLTIGQ